MTAKKTSQNYLVGAIAIIAVVGVTLFALHTRATPVASFSDPEYGISFTYPTTYSATRQYYPDHYSVVVADKAALAATSTASEGPTAITFDIFKNPRKLTLRQWVKSNPASNYQLSYGEMASSTEAGKEAVAYRWDGLYRGESYVFTNGNSIMMASVTYMDPKDKIRTDFASMLGSLQMQ
jgi:hypothetical protein